MENNLYSGFESYTETPDNSQFSLHNHNEYEIYLFMEGDSNYVVESKNYTLVPGDIIIIRKHEMHRVYHNSSTEYKRVIIMISPEFFKNHNCEEYENVFLNGSFDKGNKISADIVHSSGLYDAIMRFKKYSDSFRKDNSPVITGAVIEILYLISKISVFENPDFVSPKIKDVLNYINSNFTGDITLDMLCERFFVSKFHLCRIFKKATGLTVQMYIKRKRLTYVIGLVKAGNGLTESAIAAGFCDYSSFYRAYVDAYHENPRNIHKRSFASYVQDGEQLKYY